MDDNPRRYNQWAGNPKGTPEDPMRCVEEVPRDWLFYQCSRKRGYGPGGEFCLQHAKKRDRRKLPEDK